MLQIVGYCRVSTQRQARSVLSLKGQRKAIEYYGQQLNARLLAIYTERKPGKKY